MTTYVTCLGHAIGFGSQCNRCGGPINTTDGICHAQVQRTDLAALLAAEKAAREEHDARERTRQLLERLDAAVETLQFYANPENHKFQGGGVITPLVRQDDGAFARHWLVTYGTTLRDGLQWNDLLGRSGR